MHKNLSNKKLIILFAFFLIIGMWLFVWRQINFEYQREMEDASREGMNLAQIYENYIRSIFKNIDLDMLALRDVYQREGFAGQNLPMLIDRIRKDSFRTQIGIADEQGMLKSFTEENTKPYDISDRDYFINQRDTNSDTVYVGKTVLGRQSGQMAIPLSRRITKPDGSFGGVVVISIDPSYFSTSFKQINLGPGKFIYITGMDGIGRVLQGTDIIEQGRDISSRSKVYQSAQLYPDGTINVPSANDSITRIHSFRVLPEYSLYVDVAIADQDVLRDFIRRRIGYLLMAFLVTLFIIGFCSLLIRNNAQQRQLQNQITAKANRLQAFQNITSRLVEKFEDIDGLLKTIVHDAPRFAGTNHAVITMVDPDGKTWTTYQGAGIIEKRVGVQRPMTEGIIGEVISRGELIYLDDYLRYPQRLLDTELSAVRSVLSLPLSIESNIVGVLTVVWTQVIPQPSDEVLNTMRQYADLASVALARIRAHNEIELRNAELNRLNDLHLVGEMAAGIAHEIRNPMTTVRGYLQFITTKDLGKSYIAQFETMIEELDRANQIITEFLLLAKNCRLNLANTNLNHVINTLYPLIQADALLLNKNIQLNLADILDLPLDENQIRQLILNIVRNGLDAMGSNGTVTIRTYLEDNHVVLSIKDEGSGIAPQILQNIGIPFNTTKENGTGLGLAICYSIANRHNARIDIDSTKEGTTFKIHFPIN